MPTALVSLIPEKLDLRLYGGDGVKLRLFVTSGAGTPLELSGDITAQIRESRVNPDAIAVFTTEIEDADNGIVLISLTGPQTAALHQHQGGPVERFTGVWDVQWTPEGAEPVTILQGNVESSLDVTRP